MGAEEFEYATDRVWDLPVNQNRTICWTFINCTATSDVINN